MSAVRDMTAAQFRSALKRNGFRQTMGWWFEDVTGSAGMQGMSLGGILHPVTFKLHRRTTLAFLLKRRTELATKAAASIASAVSDDSWSGAAW